jgi:hypothetical protein
MALETESGKGIREGKPMKDQPARQPHPAEQLLALTVRTLYVLYAVFCFSVVVYAGIVLILTYGSGTFLGTDASAKAGTDPSWGPMQILLLIVGAGSLVLVAWIGRAWQRPERLWAGTQSLEALAAQLARRQAARRKDVAEPGTTEELRQRSLAGAVQHLLGRVVVAHLVPWVIAEVPAVLGLLDRFLNGSQSVWPVLMLLSAAGLLLSRPTRARLREILDPIYRTPLRVDEQ